MGIVKTHANPGNPGTWTATQLNRWAFIRNMQNIHKLVVTHKKLNMSL